MVQYFNSRVSFLSKENYYAKITAIVRVFLCVILLLDFFIHIGSIKDFYSSEGWFISVNHSFFIDYIREYIYIFFGVYFLTLILCLFGIGRNFTSILLLVLHIVKCSLIPELINWIDHILMVVLFHLIFVNSYSYLTLFKYKKNILNISTPTINLISNLGVYLIIMNTVLIYFDNGIYKALNHDWQNGQAFYFAVNCVWIEGTNFNKILADNVYVSAIATYSTLLSQLLFLPLVFFKRTKNYMMIVTITFHILLAVMFQIYKFQAIMILLHLFFYTDKEMVKGKIFLLFGFNEKA